MAFLKALVHATDKTNEWVGNKVSYLVFVAMLILVYEVFSRYVLNAPTIWAHEIARHIYGAQFMLAGGFGLLMGSHIVSDVIVGRLRPRPRAWVDVIFSVVFFFYCAMLFIRGTEMAWDSVRDLETTQTIFGSAVWPTKLAIPIGGFLILMQGIAKFIRDMYLAVTGGKLI